MERYDLLYRLYGEFDTETLREYQEFVDLFPAVDSRVALEHWQDASEELDTRKGEIRDSFVPGETFAEVAAHATRDQAFTALDLLSAYDRAINVLVLDVDETLRSAGNTDNEIPRNTLHRLTEFYESGVPIVICTGQTLENVKGFMIQGLGSEVVHSGDLSIVYESGNGVFTPGHGAETKRLLYEGLDEFVREVFDDVRARALTEAPEAVRHGCHLQGNEFNVTLKPNYETGSERAREIIDTALVYQLQLLGTAVARAAAADLDEDDAVGWARAYYADADPEIRGVLEREGEYEARDLDELPDVLADAYDRIDVAYYEADAAEISSLELNKVAGVVAALEVLGVDDPFALVMGDSKTDLRVMRWAEENHAGIAAAPNHASSDVLEHVLSTDELVFDRGKSAELLGTAYAMNCLAGLD